MLPTGTQAPEGEPRCSWLGRPVYGGQSIFTYRRRTRHFNILLKRAPGRPYSGCFLVSNRFPSLIR